MRISGFDIMVVEIPMRHTISHALAERKVARNVLVRAEDADGHIGWGECCPRPYVTGETIESVKADLVSTVFPAFMDGEYDALAAVAAKASRTLDALRRDQHAAFCAAELAVLDLAGHAFGCSAGAVLGDVRHDEVRYTGVIASERLDVIEAKARRMAELRLSEVKVKTVAGLEENRAILSAVRGILGDGVELRIDANCVWTADEALAQLPQLAEFRLAGVEQPVAAEDIEGLSRLTRAGVATIVVDESLCSLEDGRRIAEAGACHVFNLRISKNGGLVNVGRLHDLATQHGIDCQLGAQVGETGFLSLAGRHLATRRGVRWCEGSFGAMLLESDIVDRDVSFGVGGGAPAIDDPGLGAAPVREVLERYTVESTPWPGSGGE